MYDIHIETELDNHKARETVARNNMSVIANSVMESTSSVIPAMMSQWETNKIASLGSPYSSPGTGWTDEEFQQEIIKAGNFLNGINP